MLLTLKAELRCLGSTHLSVSVRRSGNKTCQKGALSEMTREAGTALGPVLRRCCDVVVSGALRWQDEA
jgi:hypothetical protein